MPGEIDIYYPYDSTGSSSDEDRDGRADPPPQGVIRLPIQAADESSSDDNMRDGVLPNLTVTTTTQRVLEYLELGPEIPDQGQGNEVNHLWEEAQYRQDSSDSGSTPSDSGSTPSDSGSTSSDSGSTPEPMSSSSSSGSQTTSLESETEEALFEPTKLYSKSVSQVLREIGDQLDNAGFSDDNLSIQKNYYLRYSMEPYKPLAMALAITIGHVIIAEVASETLSQL